MNILLSLDLSTTCTGWAKFDLDSGELLAFGFIQPNFKNPVKKGIPQYSYPQGQALKLRTLADQIIELMEPNVTKIVIEEINSGKNRLGQKVLDGFHFMLLDRMPWDFVRQVSYFDSDGKDGWRSAYGLRLQLSSSDRSLNKDRKKMNKKLGKGQKKLPLITQKDLACKYVNKAYGLNLDCDKETTDGDVADAIGLGHFYLTRIVIYGDHGKVS